MYSPRYVTATECLHFPKAPALQEHTQRMTFSSVLTVEQMFTLITRGDFCDLGVFKHSATTSAEQSLFSLANQQNIMLLAL